MPGFGCEATRRCNRLSIRQKMGSIPIAAIWGCLMAWRIIQQPDGRFARYDDDLGFEEINLTRDEAWLLCRNAVGMEAANYKMSVAESSPGRFDDVICEIRQQENGDAAVEELLKRMTYDAAVS